MEEKNITVAIHCEENADNDVYGAKKALAQGLINGFNKIGIKAFSSKQCIEDNIPFNLALGFDTAGLDIWQKILNSNTPNIMWSLDSIFSKHYKIAKTFASFPNFILFEATQADIQATGTYLPTLKHGYIPVGVDTEFWKKEECKKENDIVFFATIKDYNEIIDNLKKTMPELVFNLMMEILAIALKSPSLNFWQIYQAIKETCSLQLDADQYMLLFQNIADIVTNRQKIKLVQALSEFDLKIYGNEEWKKYISGSQKYMGACSIQETVQILNKSKIALHTHPFALCSGLHERVLNAAAVQTFCLCSDTPSFRLEFGDTLGYFSCKDINDAAKQAQYFLDNEDERLQKAQKAQNIIKEKHDWSTRATSIMKIVR